MYAFEVQDMSCGHCVNAITQALTAVDRDAKVQIDLAGHRVEVESAAATAKVLADAIREAGYTPKRVFAATVAAAAEGGGCCGSCG
ncbi:MAG: heavy-metal-associated domain-containing protein [Rubrivivax sp.]|nr:heavy-metal-associated domain-containing protein [Rubrivivax sp.]